MTRFGGRFLRLRPPRFPTQPQGEPIRPFGPHPIDCRCERCKADRRRR